MKTRRQQKRFLGRQNRRKRENEDKQRSREIRIRLAFGGEDTILFLTQKISRRKGGLSLSGTATSTTTTTTTSTTYYPLSPAGGSLPPVFRRRPPLNKKRKPSPPVRPDKRTMTVSLSSTLRLAGRKDRRDSQKSYLGQCGNTLRNRSSPTLLSVVRAFPSPCQPWLVDGSEEDEYPGETTNCCWLDHVR